MKKTKKPSQKDNGVVYDKQLDDSFDDFRTLFTKYRNQGYLLDKERERFKGAAHFLFTTIGKKR